MKRTEETKKELDLSQINDLLSEEKKVDRVRVRAQAEIHEKGYGSFYIIQVDSDQYGVFTNDNDLTSIFKFESCVSNSRCRETL